jgi:hypothetical protein
MAAPQVRRQEVTTRDLLPEWRLRWQGALWGGLGMLLLVRGWEDGWLGPLAGAILQLPGYVWYVLFSSH